VRRGGWFKEAIVVRIGDLTVDDLEYLIEQKVLEMLGDPDAGLELREEFRQRLKSRLDATSRKVSHAEVMKRFG